MEFVKLDVYNYVDAMFDSGLDATNVIESCEDVGISRLDAVIFTQYWLQVHKRDDVFEINCVDAERFFNTDGTIKVGLYVTENAWAREDMENNQMFKAGPVKEERMPTQPREKLKLTDVPF